MHATTSSPPIHLRWLGLVPYEDALLLMRAWTAARHQAARHGKKPVADAPRPIDRTDAGAAAGTASTLDRRWPDPALAGVAGDEIWLMTHPPVFTLGMNSEPGHLLAAGDIPVVQTERGGQITYHGPGQIMAYLMLDVRARRLGIRALVERIEDALIACLAGYGIEAIRQAGAPGIYVHPRHPAAPRPAAHHLATPHPATQRQTFGSEAQEYAAASGAAALPASAFFMPPPASKAPGEPPLPLHTSGKPQTSGQDDPKAAATITATATGTGTGTGTATGLTSGKEGPTQGDSPSRPAARLKSIRHLGAPAADVAKIASIGLKTSNGFSYHGLALNGQMDLSPFLRIDPCGFRHLQMTDIRTESPAGQDIHPEGLALDLGRALKTAIER